MTRDEFNGLLAEACRWAANDMAEAREKEAKACAAVLAAFSAQSQALAEARRERDEARNETGPSLIVQWIDAWLGGSEPDGHTARWAAQQIRTRLMTAGARDNGFVAAAYRERLNAAESRAAEAEAALRQLWDNAQTLVAEVERNTTGAVPGTIEVVKESIARAGAALRSAETGRAAAPKEET